MSDIELPASPGSGGATLRAGTLSMPKVLGMGAAFIAPGVIMIFNTSSLAIAVGAQAWLSILLDLPALAALVVVVTVFARRYVVTGSVMSYLGEAFGPKSRMIAGAPLLIGYVVAMPSTAIFVLTFAQGLLLDLGITWANDPTTQVLIVAIVSILAGYVAYRGVNLSARFAIACTLICAPFVIILIVAALIHSGGPGLATLGDFKSLTGPSLVGALVLVFVGVVGFEGFTALGRETKDPGKATTRIVPILVGLVVVVLLIGAIAFVPVLLQHLDQVKAGQSPSAIIADASGVGWMKIPLDATLLLSTFACMISVFNDAARVTSTAARDGMLPSGIGLISAKTGTPARAIITMGVITIGIPAISQFVVQQSPLETSTAIGPTQVYLWLVPYLALCVGVIAIKRREGALASWPTVAAVFAFVFLIVLGVYSIATAVGPIQQFAPAIALGLAAIVLIVALVRHAARPDATPVAPVAAPAQETV
jgi:amino acid transporter